jgi:hypothetical protein
VAAAALARPNAKARASCRRLLPQRKARTRGCLVQQELVMMEAGNDSNEELGTGGSPLLLLWAAVLGWAAAQVRKSAT